MCLGVLGSGSDVTGVNISEILFSLKGSYNFVKWCFFTSALFWDRVTCIPCYSELIIQLKMSLNSDPPFSTFLELQLQIRYGSLHPVYNVLGTKPKALCPLGNFFTHGPASPGHFFYAFIIRGTANKPYVSFMT